MKNAPLTVELYFEKFATATNATASDIGDSAKLASFKVKQVELFGE